MKQNSDIEDYPGKGDPWADFLHHRRRMIVQLNAEGRNSASIARTLSMDPEQPRAILDSAKQATEIYSSKR